MDVLAAVGLASPFVVLLFVLGVICAFGWRGDRTNRRIERWAVRNGLRLISADLPPGSRGETFFRLEVVDGFGRHHRGWARCRRWYGVNWFEQVEVVWDVPVDPSAVHGFPVIAKTPPEEPPPA
jgi:hypothetical protein